LGNILGTHWELNWNIVQTHWKAIKKWKKKWKLGASALVGDVMVVAINVTRSKSEVDKPNTKLLASMQLEIFFYFL
jgi:hypothetical protein